MFQNTHILILDSSAVKKQIYTKLQQTLRVQVQ